MRSLSEALERMADQSDELALEDAAIVRGRGDRRRQRQRIATFAALLLALVTGSALTYQSLGGSTTVPAETENRGDGSAVVRRIPVANKGMMTYGLGSLWVVDEGDGGVTVSDGPSGSLVQIDPASGAVVGTIPHAVGGWPVIGEGALWLSTQRMDEVTRVDLDTFAVLRHVTSEAEPGLATVQIANGSLWVANLRAGTVGQLDPQSLRVLRETPVGPQPYASATDGAQVWFSLFATNQLVRVDTATGRVASRMPVGDLEIRALAMDGSTLYVANPRTLYAVDTARVGAERVVGSVELGQPGRGGPGAASMHLGEGHLWVLRTGPNELLRIDPATLTISRRVPLPATASGQDVIGLAAGQGSVWVRLTGEVLEVRSD